MKKITALFLTLSAAALCAETAPVAAWNFDKFENNKVPAGTGKLIATAIRPDQIKSVPGKLGNAISIQGAYKGSKAGALIVRKFNFDFSKPFTVEVMFKLDKEMPGVEKKTAHRLCREIFNIADGERGPGVRFNFYYNSLALRSGDGKKAVHCGTSNTRTNVSAGEWHLATATYDGKTVSLYLDGVLASQKVMTVTQAKNTTLTIGSYKAGLCYPLRGEVNDLKFYNVCKSASDVAEKYIEIFGE